MSQSPTFPTPHTKTPLSSSSLYTTIEDEEATPGQILPPRVVRSCTPLKSEPVSKNKFKDLLRRLEEGDDAKEPLGEIEELRDAPAANRGIEELHESILDQIFDPKDEDFRVKTVRKPYGRKTKEPTLVDANVPAKKSLCISASKFYSSTPVANKANKKLYMDEKISTIKRKPLDLPLPCPAPDSPTFEVKKEPKKMRSKTKSESDEVIITLSDNEDGGDDGSGEGTSHLVEGDNVTYLPGVCLYDYQTLEVDQYLNDSIINFYLNWLQENVLDETQRKDIHIFSSHFYSKLSAKPTKTPKDGQMSNAARAYQRVKNWTKRVDLFTKRLVIIPICEDYHWFVVIVGNPGNILKSKTDQIICGKPYFLVLDSLKTDQGNSAISALKNFFRYELQDKKKITRQFSTGSVDVKYPEIPQQNNEFDCGLYLLHYVEQIFKEPSVFFFSTKDKKLQDWFSEEEVHHKREDIAKLIQGLANEGREESLQFPSIKFKHGSPAAKDKDDEDKDPDFSFGFKEEGTREGGEKSKRVTRSSLGKRKQTDGVEEPNEEDVKSKTCEDEMRELARRSAQLMRELEEVKEREEKEKEEEEEKQPVKISLSPKKGEEKSESDTEQRPNVIIPFLNSPKKDEPKVIVPSLTKPSAKKSDASSDSGAAEPISIPIVKRADSPSKDESSDKDTDKSKSEREDSDIEAVAVVDVDKSSEREEKADETSSEEEEEESSRRRKKKKKSKAKKKKKKREPETDSEAAPTDLEDGELSDIVVPIESPSSSEETVSSSSRRKKKAKKAKKSKKKKREAEKASSKSCDKKSKTDPSDFARRVLTASGHFKEIMNDKKRVESPRNRSESPRKRRKRESSQEGGLFCSPEKQPEPETKKSKHKKTKRKKRESSGEEDESGYLDPSHKPWQERRRSSNNGFRSIGLTRTVSLNHQDDNFKISVNLGGSSGDRSSAKRKRFKI